jgi:DNA-binding MarR family transcriptional regulator
MSKPRRTKDSAVDDVPTHSGAWSTPGFLLWHAALRWQQEAARVLAPLDLTYAQFTLLAGIWWLRREVGGTSPSQRDLADHTGISPMMTSQVLRRLETAGFVERLPDRDDTRVRRLTLTSSGAALARKAVATVDEADRSFFAEIQSSREEMVAMFRGIARRSADGTRTDGLVNPG